MIQGATWRLTTVRENSLGVHGPRLFNAMPRDVREAGFRDDGNPSVVIFKTKLDNLLAEIPDEPRLRHYSQGQPSNSITHQINRSEPRNSGNLPYRCKSPSSEGKKLHSPLFPKL